MTNVRIIYFSLIALLASMTVVSCSKEELGNDSNSYEINFNCNEIGVKSATDATVEDLKSGFKIYAHTTFEPQSSTPTTASSFQREVYHDGQKWTYENTMLWIPDATFNFRGYFPADAVTINETGYNEYEMFYTNIADKSDQVDLLFASATKSTAQAKQDSYAAVSLNFNHILSRINIKVKVDATGNVPKLGAIVKGVGLSDIADNARFTNGQWTDFYGSADIGHNATWLIGESKIVEKGDQYEINLDYPEGEKLFEDEDSFLVIPQKLNDKVAALRMYVDIITPPVKNAEGEYEYEILMQDQPLVCNIPAITWEKAKQYTYIVTITQSFSINIEEPEIEDWEDSKMSGTIIIR